MPGIYGGQKGHWIPLEMELQMGASCHVGARVDQGPLQERALVTAEPSLQHHMVSFLIRCWLHECIRFVQVKLGAHSLLLTLRFTYQFLKQLPLWNTLLRGGRPLTEPQVGE